MLEIAVLDALGLENSVARSQTLIAGALAAAKLLEAEQIESFAISIEDDGCHDQAMVWLLACRQQPGGSKRNRYSACS